MFNITFSQKAFHQIQAYISRYREYYQELYLDSWIWNENLIISWYVNESENRYDEIRNIIKQRLSEDIPSYPHNKAIIPWRTKVLFISFEQDDDTRIITYVDIR